ncbi:uncharacterized protein LOC111259738 isoform X1 [Varroa jacobsoni]|uniref:uncharacterized protein LOC111259738 isoform X1 n=1 Tax=Varroa jacobsoni TaxID=62625 RepID=UPI000BF4A5E0|nr:uncharacterized protein LOC111259738 isoform X1 [Varroa jacobsoni]
MLRFVLCGAILTSLTVAQDMFEDKTHVMTARCRAQCLNKFHLDGSKETCFNINDCLMCWDTCNLFYKNFKVWGSMCEQRRLCFPGCQEACNFYHSHSDIIEATRTDTHFTQPLKYSYRPEDDTIHFEWSRPEGNDQVDPLVYVLMMQDQVAATWQQLEQTVYHNATVRRGLLKPSSWLRLTAYDSNGKIARIEKSCAEFDINMDIDKVEDMFRDEASRDEKAHRVNDDDSADYVDYYQQWVPILNVLRYSTANPGGIDAIITWPHVSNKADIKYEVEWKHSNDTIDITGHLYTHGNIVTITLWPNSIYQISVRAFASSSHRAVAQSRSLYVDTATDVSGTHPFFESCPGCIPVEYLAGLAVGVAAIAFIIAVALVFIKLCHQDRNASLEVGQLRSVNSAFESTKRPTSFKRSSVKKQLSSISNLITHGSCNSSAEKHDRLIEDESYGNAHFSDSRLCDI